tara:strand:+ start:336 stop:500 length:165 start_codon:yes stop_codon:yes gene_type:complete
VVMLNNPQPVVMVDLLVDERKILKQQVVEPQVKEQVPQFVRPVVLYRGLLELVM